MSSSSCCIKVLDLICDEQPFHCQHPNIFIGCRMSVNCEHFSCLRLFFILIFNTFILHVLYWADLCTAMLVFRRCLVQILATNLFQTDWRCLCFLSVSPSECEKGLLLPNSYFLTIHDHISIWCCITSATALLNKLRINILF
jgi:hypothetical protein